MAKMTLLEMTQSILSAMDSDDVNNIDDTTESLQVATFIKECYFDLIGSREWPFLKRLDNLEGLADTDTPTTMEIPEDISKVYWVRYNKKAVTYMPPAAFKELVDGREELADVVDEDGYVINADPLYWTTFDDHYIVFDGYDSDEESTLQTSNCEFYGLSVPTWTHSDTFVPDLPEKMFPTLLADAKGTSFLNVKQQANAKEEKKARTGRVRFQREAWRVEKAENATNDAINYGRK